MAAGTYGETLRRPGLQSFLWAQFLGAFNDNLFKIALSLLLIHKSGAEAAGRGLSLVGAIFVLPFLLFSGYAGQLADMQSKRSVLITIKCLEIGTAALASVALITERLELSYLVLLLFALQATFFSPAKYGILCAHGGRSLRLDGGDEESLRAGTSGQPARQRVGKS